MMHNSEEYLLDSGRMKGDEDSSPDLSSALQFLRIRLGLENFSGLDDQPESQENALRNLSHLDWTIRIGAVRMLAASGKLEFVEPLMGLLQDENVAVRKAVVKALGDLEATNAVASLLSCLNDEDWSVRATALQSLGKLGEFVPIEPLIASLQDRDVSVRLAAVKALEKQAKRVPFEVFVALLKDKDSLVRIKVMQVIEKLLERPEKLVLTGTLVDVLVDNIRSEENEVSSAASMLLRKLVTRVSVGSLFTTQEAKVQQMQEMLFRMGFSMMGKEQWHWSFLEAALFLPIRRAFFSEELKKHSVRDCIFHKALWIKEPDMASVEDLIKFWGTLERRTTSADVIGVKSREGIILCECKNSLISPEPGKQVVPPNLSSVTPLVHLYTFTHDHQELRHLVWSICGPLDLVKFDFIVKLLIFLLEVLREPLVLTQNDDVVKLHLRQERAWRKTSPLVLNETRDSILLKRIIVLMDN
jgi:hypothetical protein